MEYYEDEPLNEVIGMGLRQVGELVPKVAPKVASKAAPKATSKVGNYFKNLYAGAYNHVRQNQDTIAHRTGDALAALPGAATGAAKDAAKGTVRAAARHPWYTTGAGLGGAALYSNTSDQLENEAIEQARQEAEERGEEFDPDDVEHPGVVQTLRRSGDRINNARRAATDRAGQTLDSIDSLAQNGFEVRHTAPQLGGDDEGESSDESGSGDPGLVEKLEDRMKGYADTAKTVGKYGAAAGAVAAGVGGYAMYNRMKHTRWLSTRCAMTKSPSERKACEKFIYNHEMKQLRKEKKRCVHANDPVNCEERVNQEIEELENEFNTN